MKNGLFRIYGITIMINYSPSKSVLRNSTRINKTEDMANEISSGQSWRHVFPVNFLLSVNISF